ncbi:MAG: glycosyltransferase family 4 protein [Synergistales bacterium]|nr:glycosyltransferase family 4 protein [Synergistales bacterium]
MFYCYAKGDDRPWEIDWPFMFHAEVLPGRAWLGQHNGYWNPSILKKLRAKRYDAIILGGYNHFTMLAAAWYARRNGTPYYLMSEVYLRQPRSRLAKVLKRPLLYWLLRSAAGGLPTGSLAKEYLTFYGLSEDRICCVPNAPDISRLKLTANRYWTTPKPEIRRSLGLAPQPMVLFVGRLLALKNVDKLIIAFREIVTMINAQLVIIGSGPEEPNLRSLADSLTGAGQIIFPGFVGPRDLPQWYCAADVFVLPSYDETWGVVVLEALACGCPVVVSDMVGSGPDVINSPEVGTIVPANEVPVLRDAILKYLRQQTLPTRVAEAWEPVAQRMNHEAVAKRLVDFLRKTSQKTSLD